MAKKRSRNSNKARKSRKPETQVETGSTALVWVDSEPLRRQLRGNIKRTRTYYRRAQKEWELYESEILPFFEEWMRETEGGMPQRIRELQGFVSYQGSLLDRVQMFQYDFDVSKKKAFAMVMDQEENREIYADIFSVIYALQQEIEEKRRKKMEEEMSFFSKFQGEANSFDDDLDMDLLDECRWQWDEKARLNRDELNEFAERLGLRRAGLSAKEKRALVEGWLEKPDEEILERMRGVRKEMEERTRSGGSKGAGSFSFGDEDETNSDTARNDKGRDSADSEGSAERRCKAKYRKLILLLHPDHNRGGEGGESGESGKGESVLAEAERLRLYSITRQAWAERDEEKLDVVLTQIELKQGEVELKDDLGFLQRSWEHHRAVLKSLRKTLSKVKKESAWGCFSCSPEEREVEREEIRACLQEDLDMFEEAVKDLEKELKPLKKGRGRFSVESLRKAARKDAREMEAALREELEELEREKEEGMAGLEFLVEFAEQMGMGDDFGPKKRRKSKKSPKKSSKKKGSGVNPKPKPKVKKEPEGPVDDPNQMQFDWF